MAVTVEELQIILKCDAQQAQATLDSLQKKVEDTVDKVAKGGKGKGETSYYDKISKKIQAAMKQAEEALQNFEETGDSGAKSNFGYYIAEAEKLSKQLQKVSQNADRAMASLNGGASAPTVTAPETQQRGAYKDQWSPVSQSDLASGEVGAMRASALEHIKNAANDVGAALQKIDTDKLTNGTPYERLAEQLKVVQNQAESLRAKIAAIGDSDNPQALMTLQTKLDTAEKKAEKLAMQMAAIEDAVPQTTSAESPASSIEATGNAAQEAKPKVDDYRKSVEKAGIAGKVFAGASKFAHGAVNAFSKASKFAHNVMSHFGKSTRRSEGFLSKFGATLKRVIMRMMAMALVRGFINGIRKGLELIAKASPQAAKELGKFKVLGSSIQAALGSAALAVLNAFAGVLYTIASAAITAANAVARFFAIFGNGTYYAVSMAEGFDDLGESIGGAGGAAKGLLADFDELNIIGQKGGGGGGGSQTGLGSTTVSPEQAVSPLAELLKSKQFEEAGAYIADKLDGIVNKVDGFFVKLKDKNYGESFAQILNGIFKNETLFADLGKTVGDGINSIFSVIGEFAETFDGTAAGEAFATGVNVIFETVDWEANATAVGTGINTVLDTIDGFITEVNWDNLGKKLSKGVNKLFKTVKWEKIGKTFGDGVNGINTTFENFVNDFDGKGLGEGLASGVNEMVKTVDWDLVGRLISEGTNKITVAIKSFVDNFDGASLGEGLATAISNSISGIDFTKIGAAGTVILIDALDFVLAFLGNMDWIGIFEGVIEMMISAPLSIIEGILQNPAKLLRIVADFVKLILKSFATLATSGILAVWDVIATAMIDGANAIVPGLGDKLFGDFKGLGESIKDGIDEGIDKIVEPIDEAADLLEKKLGKSVDKTSDKAKEQKKAFNEARDMLKQYKVDVKNASDSVNGLVDALKSIPKKIKTTISVTTKTAASGSTTGSTTTTGLTKAPVEVKIGKFASGGIAYGNTLANVGEYAGVRSNPEVIAPLNKLQDILSNSNRSTDSKALSRQNALLEEQNRLLRQIAAKELKIGASAELGQIVQKSQALYGAV